MPVNLDALLRYHTINHCLQQPGKKWTWEELANACADYLDEVAYRTTRSIPSKRTIQQDIKVMRSGDLGYNAPIINQNGKYFYEDIHYSIKNSTLNYADLNAIATAAKILGQYKGFNFFEDLNPIFSKFESRLQIKLLDDFDASIEFEKYENSKGTEYLKYLLSAILQKTVLKIGYKKFNDSRSKQHIVHPYLLKEHDGRWYLLGWHQDGQYIVTLALDRMENLEQEISLTYRAQSFNAEQYFYNTLGVTFNGEAPKIILMKVEKDYAPYLLTKPMHRSQRLIQQDDNGYMFEYNLVINQELENWIMAHCNHLEIVHPLELKQAIFSKIQKAIKKFY